VLTGMRDVRSLRAQNSACAAPGVLAVNICVHAQCSKNSEFWDRMEKMSTENCTYAVPLGARVQEQLAVSAADAGGVNYNSSSSSRRRSSSLGDSLRVAGPQETPTGTANVTHAAAEAVAVTEAEAAAAAAAAAEAAAPNRAGNTLLESADHLAFSKETAGKQVQ
jgi:hypothetical protein